MIGLGSIVTAAALVLGSAISANAALADTQGSAHPLYLLNAETGDPYVEGSSLGWIKDAIA